MKIEQVLQTKFGFNHFREGQREIIEDLLAGNHVLAVLPTGTGKSLCYQLPAYFMKRPVLIVSPLLSLMEDQVQQLKANGEKNVIALNSFLREEEKKEALRHLAAYRFIYASPEILQNAYVIQALQSANVGLFVVDEAHCISQWGHDFRLDYLHLGDVWQSLGKPICLALTGTATNEVLEDIKHYLQLKDAHEHLYSMNRPNIAMNVEYVEGVKEKKEKLLAYVKHLQNPGIIYCSSRALTEELTVYLKENGIENVQYYHGGMESSERMLIQQQFLENQLDVICCTSAFGMGVNKRNVRFVIHFQPPPQLESYVQEIGRSGRDGEDSIAILLYHEGDDELAYSLLEMELPSSDIVFYCLSTLRTNKQAMSLKKVEDHFLFTIGIQETHWRFLRYYLQKEGVIVGDTVYPSLVQESLHEKIVDAVKERLQNKYRKYTAMKQFIHTHECRRQLLMRYFEEEGLSEKINCCDQCGISLDDYKKRENLKKKRIFKDWESELRILLRQGEE
ncbi:RecQ family ATP-dependent DNA helicase [Priestia megaterium]|nr:RecQ family ATP-dependent DNA helicase [Priestia megaterium]